MQFKQTGEKIFFRANREMKINLPDKLDMVNLVGSRFSLMKLHHLAKYALSKKKLYICILTMQFLNTLGFKMP